MRMLTPGVLWVEEPFARAASPHGGVGGEASQRGSGGIWGHLGLAGSGPPFRRQNTPRIYTFVMETAMKLGEGDGAGKDGGG